jgi:hypothetical protein
MPRKPIDFGTVRQIAMSLPEVEESTSWGVPAYKLHGNLLACQAINRSAEPGSLVVKIDFNLRAELLAAEPDVYYLTPHYENYPSVLVRLERISRRSLRKLLGTAWVYVGSEPPRRRAKSRTKKSARSGRSRRMRRST